MPLRSLVPILGRGDPLSRFSVGSSEGSLMSCLIPIVYARFTGAGESC
jgi:hypothetical protein